MPVNNEVLAGYSVWGAGDTRAGRWALHLLDRLGARPASDAQDATIRIPDLAEAELGREWASSGLLGGATRARPLASLASPVDILAGCRGAAAALAALTDALGKPVRVDAVALLTERMALAGSTPRPAVSRGGGARLLRATDGWVAIGLRRPDDVDLVAALVGRPTAGDPWAAVTSWVA